MEPAAAEHTVAAASAAERAECEARYAAACAAAAAAGAPAPFRGPAADSPLGERFLDVISLVSASGFALDARPARYLCGLTFRLGARRADGTLDRAGFLGGTADMMDCALRLQVPWLEEERLQWRTYEWMRNYVHLVVTSLMRAADNCDEQRVRELLAAGAPLHCVDETGWTALHYSSDYGDARSVAALLEADTAGVTVNALDRDGRTPLFLASRRSKDAVRALLARGARQDLRRDNGSSALHQAAHSGEASVIELLCAAPGAEVDAQDSNGYTPLMIASLDDHSDAVRALLARGARQDLQDCIGWTALHSAARRGHAGVAELLCAGPGAAAALALRDRDGCTPLALAVKSGNAPTEAVLCAHGAS